VGESDDRPWFRPKANQLDGVLSGVESRLLESAFEIAQVSSQPLPFVTLWMSRGGNRTDP
jgi:hypothetical protein